MNAGPFQTANPWPELGIDLSAANEKRGFLKDGPEFFGAANNIDSGHGPITLARQHDIAPPWQGPSQAVKSAAPHDDGAALRQALEVLQIGRQMPGHLTIQANDVVLSTGNNGGQFRQLCHDIVLF